MNEVFVTRLFRDAGVPAPRTAYARVFVTVPGKFAKRSTLAYIRSLKISIPLCSRKIRIQRGRDFQARQPLTCSPIVEKIGLNNAQMYDARPSPLEQRQTAGH